MFTQISCPSTLIIVSVVAAQVTVTADAWGDIGTNTTLRCATPDNIRELIWGNSSFSTTDVTKFVVIFTVHTNMVFNINESHYVFDKDDHTYPVTIKTLTLEDEAKYWCEVNVAGIGSIIDSVNIRIRGTTILHL